MRKEDTVARLGGDEFVILTGTLKTPSEASQLAERIHEQLRTPFLCGGHEVAVTASIGIVDGTEERPVTVQTLLRDADTAMYAAKKNGKNHTQAFRIDMHEQAIERLNLEHELRGGFERGDFVVHYQPLVDARTGRITAFEALVRWRHAERGLLRPFEFIAVAEEIGLMIPLGEWVLRSACAESMAWQAAGLPPVRVGVNLSLSQFRDAGLVDLVERVLRETGIEPSLVELELSEDIVLSAQDFTVRQLEGLAQLGVRLSIDDFGIVHTSVRYLANFPIATLKIDKSFLRGGVPGHAGGVVMKALIALGHSLELNVVVEGVETSEEAAFARNCGCDEIQGFYTGPVVGADEARAVLTSERERASRHR